MKKLYLVFFLLCIGQILSAQNRNTYDKLYQRMRTQPSEKIIDLADRYMAKSNEDSAITLYSIAYSRFNENMDEKEKILCVLSFLKTGNIYFIQGNYNNAFEFYIKGFKVLEYCNDKRLLPQFYISFGNVYCIFMDYEKGINCYEKAYNLCRTYPNKQYEYNALINMTSAYNYMNNAEKAKEFYFKAKQITRPEDTVKNYMNLLNWGLIMLNEKKYQEAIRIFHKSTTYAREKELEPRYECSSYEELYKIYHKLGNQDSTFHYLKRCNYLAKKYGLTDILIQNLKTYADIYKNKGDMVNSLIYKDRYLTMSDSIFNVREFNRVKNVQYVYEIEKTSKEISTLNEDKKVKEQKIRKQRIIIFEIILGLLTLGGLLIIVYKQKRRLSQAYNNLFEINQEVVVSNNHNKSLRMQYEKELFQVNKQIEDYKEQQENIYKTPNTLSHFDMIDKYQSSNLADTQKQDLLDSIIRVMETTEEFCKEDFSLDKLSMLVNSNSKYVSQVINETYHKNFNTYINEYRVREARQRITDIKNYGNYTIKAIAESVGYKSNTTFVNAFKSLTGITPSVFQKKVIEEYENERKNR